MKAKSKITNCPHMNRAHFALGKCANCYSRDRHREKTGYAGPARPKRLNSPENITFICNHKSPVTHGTFPCVKCYRKLYKHTEHGIAKRQSDYMRNKENPEWMANRVAVAKAYRASPTGKLAAKRDRLKRFFGMTVEAYDALLVKQGNKCSICKCDLTDIRTALDHDHSTGQVREILCQDCNHGLGNFRDNTTFLADAIEYLRRYSNAQGATQ